MAQYDCIIAGAGPAGIFAALELALNSGKKGLNPFKGLKILLIEKGKDINERSRKDIFCGWGGAGAYSDGKLNLSRDIGGSLNEYVGAEELDELIACADSIFLKYGVTSGVKGADRALAAPLEDGAARAGLKLMTFPIRHIGTDRCVLFLKQMRDALSGRIETLFGAEAAEVMHDSGKVTGIRTTDGREHRADFVILCPGRAGSNWLQGVARALSISTTVNPVDIGVRVEVPAQALRFATDVLHEAKLIYNSKRFDDPVRTFCMNPYGVVVREQSDGFSTVNGHSFSVKKSENTNFALLVSTTFTEPFHEANAYGEYIARLANLLGEGIIVQRLGDLQRGRRSTAERIKNNPVRPSLKDAAPGDLSFALPYRYLTDISEMIEALDRFAPGINSPSTLLYGAEVKFYSMRLKLTNRLETPVKNLFAAGDGAGVTRGIIQASVSGIIAAREILRRMAH
ncbi:MAG: FAD-dependent oxidoreductase [Deltaproteobacteria bacterium]|nr:FAD-dependent oxidoreductase [Deltaproteobacteria bacterium]